MLQVDGAQENALGERRRYGAVEVVGMEAQPAQLAQVSELVSEWAGEM